MKLQAVKDDQSDQNFRALEREFPLRGQNIADEVIEPGHLSTSTMQLFLQLAVAANRKVAFGSASVTFTASKFAAEKSVEHGLGTTPVAVLATSQFAEVTVGARNLGATTFGLVAGNWLEALSASRTVYWIAIG